MNGCDRDRFTQSCQGQVALIFNIGGWNPSALAFHDAARECGDFTNCGIHLGDLTHNAVMCALSDLANHIREFVETISQVCCGAQNDRLLPGHL